MLYIVLDGLPTEFYPFCSAMRTRNDSISFEELHVLMLGEEKSLNKNTESSKDSLHLAMVGQVPKGTTGNTLMIQFNSQSQSNRGGRGGRFNNYRGGRGGRNFNSNRGGFNNLSPQPSTYNSQPSSRPTCQICYKNGHTALDCYHRMDFAFQGKHPPTKLAAMTFSSNASSSNCWVSDTGATDHFTPDLANLQQARDYNGNDAVTVGNGQKLPITHIGNSQLRASKHILHLRQALRVPNMKTNLLSVFKCCKDNNCCFHFDASKFSIQDIPSGKVLYKGFNEAGLYPIYGDPFHSTKVQTPCPTFTKSALPSFHKSAYTVTKVSSSTWHSRLGHPNSKILQFVFKHLPTSPIDSSSSNSFCKHCTLGKMSQLPFSHSCTHATEPLQLVHSDVWGPAPITSINGTRYYVSFIDDFSKFTWFFPLKHKSQVLSTFVHFKSTLENLLNYKLKVLRTDCGGEYTDSAFQHYCSSQGIFHQFSCPHTPQQNRVAERKHRHIIETALTLISQSSLPLSYWPYAFASSIFLINRLPTVSLHLKSPWEVLFHTPPDYSFFKVFGCSCYPLLTPYNKHKLQFKSQECIFLGYATHSKGYMCLDPTNNKLIVSRNVTFDETSFPFSNTTSSTFTNDTTPSPTNIWLSSLLYFTTCTHPSLLGPIPSLTSHPPTTSTSISNSIPISPATTSTLELIPETHNTTIPASQTQPTPQTNTIAIPASQTQPAPQTNTIAIPASQTQPAPQTHTITNNHPMQTRLKSGISKKKLAFTSTTVDYLDVEPPSFSIASALTPWVTAMEDEFSALHRQGTWSLVPHDNSQNIVGCKWVYKVKRHADGSVSRYKARLVAKGFHQQAGLDYDETFSPVIKPTTVRIILTLAAHYTWPLRQLDISNAFLHGFLKEDVYMAQPQGFIDPLRPNHVCKLHKSLYGLKQAPRAWFERFTSQLEILGFHASTADPSLFTFKANHDTLYLLLYVDDIIITGTSPSLITNLIHKLQTTFELKDLGPLHYFLGLQLHYHTTGFSVHQTKYASDLLQRFDMTNCKPSSTPYSSTSRLTKDQGTPLVDPTSFRSLVGALQYLTFTRPDLSFAVNQVCQFMHSPTDTHLIAAKWILRYIKGSLSSGLLFQPGSLNLQAYADADWAGDPLDRRSTSGYVVFLGFTPITWVSKKQCTVSRSSTEAEYRSLASATAEVFWIRMVLKDLGLFLPNPPILWCDNLSALALASNPVFHARTKHIEVDYHFI
jgi:hypothetical protein